MHLPSHQSIKNSIMRRCITPASLILIHFLPAHFFSPFLRPPAPCMLITRGWKRAWLKSHPAQSPLLSSHSVSTGSFSGAGGGTIHNEFHSLSLRVIELHLKLFFPCGKEELFVIQRALPGTSFCNRVSYWRSQADPSGMGPVLIRFYHERWKHQISILFSIYSSF